MVTWRISTTAQTKALPYSSSQAAGMIRNRYHSNRAYDLHILQHSRLGHHQEDTEPVQATTVRDGEWWDVPAMRGVTGRYGVITWNRKTWVYTDKTKRMSIMDEMAIVIKIMRLLRTGKIDRTTTNIEVLKLLKNETKWLHRNTSRQLTNWTSSVQK